MGATVGRRAGLSLAAILAVSFSVFLLPVAKAQSPWPFSLSDGTTSFGVYLGLLSGGAGSGASLGTITSNNFTVFTNNTDRIIVTNTGLVGIGTSSPGSRLHIVSAGSSYASDLASSMSLSTQFIQTKNNSAAGIAYSQIAPNIQAIQGVYSDGSASTPLVLNPYGGNVGIGTTSFLTNSKLSIAAGDTTSETGAPFVIGGGSAGKMGLYAGVNSAGSYSYLGSVNATYVYGNLILNPNGGNVGIGTTSPGALLTLGSGGTGTNTPNIKSYINSVSGESGGISFYDINAGETLDASISPNVSTLSAGAKSVGLDFSTVAGGSFATRMVITPTNGYVGIGLTNPSYQLQLSADSAAKPSTNTWTIASDARIKTGIRPFNDGLSVIDKINPVWYRYNGKGGFAADGKDYIGVIAQDIGKVAPYTVSTYRAKLDASDANDTELLNFNSHALTFVLINAVKELDAKNLGQQKEIELLKSRIAALEMG